MSFPYRPLLCRFAATVLRATVLSLAVAMSAAAQDIVVGQVLDQTGLAREISRDYFAGAKVYFDDVNLKGGINGRRIVQLVRNDEGDPKKTAQLTAELIERDHADVLFGYVGDANLRAASSDPAFRKSGIALVGAVAGGELDGRNNVYLTRTTYADEARHLIDYFGGIGMRRFAVLHAQSESGEALRDALVGMLKRDGLAPVRDVSIRADSLDVAAAAQKVFASRPQVVILLADTLPSAAFIKIYRALDPAAMLTGTSLINHRALLEFLGPGIANGVLLTQVVPDPARLTQPLMQEHLRLMKQYLDEPPSHATLEGFIAAKTLVQALRASVPGARRADIARAVRNLRNVDLGGYYVDFANGHRGFAFIDVALMRGNGQLLY